MTNDARKYPRPVSGEQCCYINKYGSRCKEPAVVEHYVFQSDEFLGGKRWFRVTVCAEHWKIWRENLEPLPEPTPDKEILE